MDNRFSKQFKQIIEKQNPCEIVYVLMQVKLALYELGIFDDFDASLNLGDMFNARRTGKSHSEMSKEKAITLKNRLKDVIYKDAKHNALNTSFFEELDPKAIPPIMRLALTTDNLALELRNFMDANPRRTGINFAPVAVRQLMQTLLVKLAAGQKFESLCDPLARTGDMLFAWPPLPFKYVHLSTDNEFEEEIAKLFWNVVTLSEHDSSHEEEFITQQQVSVSHNQPILSNHFTSDIKYDAIISAIGLPYRLPKLDNQNAKTFSTMCVEYTLHALNKNGIAVLLIEDGFFHRSTFDYQIREQLIDEDLVDMVISLPANLYLKNAHFNANILVIRKNKPTNYQNQVRFINIHTLKELESSEIKSLGSCLSESSSATKDELTSELKSNIDSTTIRADQIRENGFSLRPLDYLQVRALPRMPNLHEESEKLHQLLDEWKSLQQSFQNAVLGEKDQ
jgi:hypothetical protein